MTASSCCLSTAHDAVLFFWHRQDDCYLPLTEEGQEELPDDDVTEQGDATTDSPILLSGCDDDIDVRVTAIILECDGGGYNYIVSSYFSARLMVANDCLTFLCYMSINRPAVCVSSCVRRSCINCVNVSLLHCVLEMMLCLSDCICHGRRKCRL